jgi:hypothetical protein
VASDADGFSFSCAGSRFDDASTRGRSASRRRRRARKALKVKRLALRSKTANPAHLIDATSSFSAIQSRSVAGQDVTGVRAGVDWFRYEVMHAEGSKSLFQP